MHRGPSAPISNCQRQHLETLVTSLDWCHQPGDVGGSAVWEDVGQGWLTMNICSLGVERRNSSADTCNGEGEAQTESISPSRKAMVGSHMQ